MHPSLYSTVHHIVHYLQNTSPKTILYIELCYATQYWAGVFHKGLLQTFVYRQLGLLLGLKAQVNAQDWKTNLRAKYHLQCSRFSCYSDVVVSGQS